MTKQPGQQRCCLLLLLLMCLVGAVHTDTLPTLTIQPLNYFTLHPPSSRTPSPSSSLDSTQTERRRNEEKTRDKDGSTVVDAAEGEVEEDEGDEEDIEEPSIPQPGFSSVNATVSVHQGAEATLDCTVTNPKDNQSVSWLRLVDDMLELLTWDDHTYANDNRYSVVEAAGWEWRRWRLVIRQVKAGDQGQYRCHLATHPPKVLVITLHVIVPTTRVVDGRGGRVAEQHYQSGSRIELTCVIEQVPFPHGPVTWRRGAATLAFNTSTGGIRSRLYVADATPTDSGLYTCCYHAHAHAHTCDSVAVHVLAGENSAAMQHDASPADDSSSEVGSGGVLYDLPSPSLLLAAFITLDIVAGIITVPSTFHAVLITIFRLVVVDCASILFQLFEAPVIQITSASLVQTGNKNDGNSKRKTYEGDKRGGRSCLVGGEMSTGGSITLLTSDGKTYFLPQSITSGGNVGTGYIIAEEVLNAEEVLQPNSVLREEQMLTISPPPPSALDFPSSDARTPDALAIATSEVFNENYIPLPLDTPGHVNGTRAFQFKAEEDVRQNTILNSKTHPRLKNCEQKHDEPSLFCSEEVDNWLGNEVKEQLMKKSDLAKREGEAMDSRADGNEATHPLCHTNRIDDSDGKRAKQVDHIDSVNYSIISKWYGTRNETADDFTIEHPLNSNVCRKITGQKTKVEVENLVGIKDDLTSFPVDDKKPSVSKKCEKVQASVSPTANLGTLRRSSRIRRTKKVTSESPQTPCLVGGDSRSQKRCKGVRGEMRAALWECGSCDAMFRTKAGRDRHLEEGHAFTCYVCGWRGNSKTKYEVHISTVHCHHQARCLACRKDFESYEQYRQHMHVAHPTTSIPSVKEEVECDAAIQERLEGEAVEQEGERKEENLAPQEQSKIRDKEKRDTDMSQTIIASHMRGNRTDVTRVDTDAGNVTDGEAYQGYRAEQGCPYCGKTFHRRSRFIRHLNYHLGNRSFLCKICNKSFVEKSGLDAHHLTHQPLNAPCNECGKIFKTPRTMKRHLRTHLDRTLACEVCKKVFRHEESLRVHKAVHREGGSGNICEVCEKDCKTPYYLQLHLSTKHEAAKFTCLRCQRSFKWKQSYRKHMALYHGEAQLKYKCGLCTRRFLTTSELRIHQVVHSSERKHLCDVCGKAFKHEYTRDKHVKTVHRDDREHMCPQCGALFKAKAYLDQHLSHVHTTKERVKCKHCGHDFKTEANLRSHIKTVHKTKNRKYPCKNCCKTFLAPKDLARHSKVHTGVKDFSCPKCHRCFSRKDNMAAHLRTHVIDQEDLSYNSKSEPAGLSQIINLPTSASSDLPNSSNVLLPSIPPIASNITHVATTSSNNTVLTNLPIPSENATLAGVSLSSENTSLSSTSAPVCLPATSNGIILSTVPIASLQVAEIPVSSSSQATQVSFSTTHSTSAPHCYTHPTHNSLSQSAISSSSGLITATSATTSPNMMVTTSRTPQQHTFSLHSHLVPTSLPAVVSSLQSSSSPLPSTVLSLPTHSVSPSPGLITQPNQTQMVCSSFQSDQVVLTSGVLSAASTTPLQQTHTSPHYTQLDPMGVTISSSGPITTLETSVPSCTALGPGITTCPSSGLSLEENHHRATERGIPQSSLEPGIIFPTTSLLPDTALIIPEKTGVYTLVSDGGKMTPLETLALQPIPACHSASGHPPSCPPPHKTHNMQPASTLSSGSEAWNVNLCITPMISNSSTANIMNQVGRQ
ncbi:hypothetical protein Pmani_023557 [Petrolisthes manimaculis]|uniref:Uncharacterized protein n=1 Tax=Petrolisthes manimaculis TaxID=1843537 RepID=A0AAE1U0Z0_9EUCA|nr:hypothetical protein Pmani_023557 [Petrolisthes manimaculis]